MTLVRAIGWLLGILAVVILVVIAVRLINPAANTADRIAAAVQEALKKKPSATKQRYKSFEWRADAEPTFVSDVPCVAKGIPGFRGVGHDGKTGCVHD